MKILDQVPFEHRRTIHKTLLECKESGRDYTLGPTPDKYYHIDPINVRRLNLASVITKNNQNTQIGFRILSNIFARQERIIPWWMWITFAFTENGRVFRSAKEGASKAAFVREDVIDLLIDELKKRAGVFGSGLVAQQGAGGSKNDNEEISKHGMQGDPRIAELNEYVQNMGLDDDSASKIISNDLLAKLMASIQEINSAQISLSDVNVQLDQIKQQISALGIAPDVSEDLVTKIKQVKDAKEESVLIAFLKNQVEMAINLSIINNIHLNPELYYLMPGLMSQSESLKVGALVTQLAFLQQLLAANINLSTVSQHSVGEAHEIAVLLKLNPTLQMHLDNITASVPQNNPEMAAAMVNLDTTIRAMTSSQPDLPQELLDAVKLNMQKNQIVVDLQALIHETAKMNPGSADQLNDIARQISQTFGELDIKHNLLAKVAADAHISAPEHNNTQAVQENTVTFDAQTHRRTESMATAIAESSVAVGSSKVAEITDVKRVLDEAVTFDVKLQHSLQSVVEMVGQGLREAGFKDHEFKIGEYHHSTKSVVVEATLEQALNLANNHKHINAAIDHHAHEKHAGRGF